MRTPLLAAILFLVCSVSIAQKGNKLFNNDIIHEIRMYSDDPNLWEALLLHYSESQSGAENVYNPVELTIDGTALTSVGLRIKGYSSAWGTESRKKPFRLDFNEFVPGQEYDGLKKISLNNAYSDVSVMRDVIAYDILRKEGVAASRTAYANVYINEEYFGLYIIAEQVDKTFLKNNFDDEDGNLYKCIGWSHLLYEGDDKNIYKSTIELKTNESKDDWTEFIEFIRYLNKEGVTDEQYKEEFPKLFDVPVFLKVLAIDILLVNWDSYYDHGRNFYIYDDPSTGKMTWIPWDYNLSFSTWSNDILALHLTMGRGPKPLIRNLLEDPEMVDLLMDTYKKILRENFTIDRLAPIIDKHKRLIRETVAKDPNYLRNYTLAQFDASLEENTVIHHEDTVEQAWDVEHIYMVPDGDNINDTLQAREQGKMMIVDTTLFYKHRFEIIDFGGGPRKLLIAKVIFKFDQLLVGLKGFIRDRIAKVRDEMAELGYITDIETAAIDDTDFSISPNPSSRTINFSGTIADRPFDIAVFDAAGTQLRTSREGNALHVEHLAPGMYFLKVKSTSGIFTRKFFKVNSDIGQ